MKIFKISFLLVIMNLLFIYSQTEKGLKIKKSGANEVKRWAICIGVNDYNDENIVDLKNAVNDALNLGKVLQGKGEFDKIITLVDDYSHFQEKMLPTKSNIEKRIDYILSFASPEDLIVFSFSGHGISDEKGDGYLITQDTEINKKFETSIKVSDIVKKFKEKNIKKTLLIIDACREEIAQSKSIGTKSMLAEVFKESEVAATFYSTKAGWFSYEDTETKFGVFTRFMLEGLSGSADSNDDGLVTFSELENFVQRAVNDYSLRNNRMQKPFTKIYGEKYGDIPLTVAEEEDLSKQPGALQSVKSIEGLTSFKASLKADEEYKTAVLSWAKNPSANFDEVVILKSKNKSIDINLENSVNYAEGEKIANTEAVVYKILKNNIFSITDNTLSEDSTYFFKIFTRVLNNGSPVYSKAGIEKSFKTLIDEETIQIRLDKLKVLKVTEENASWGAELTWKIEVATSTGYKYLLSNRPRKDYKAFVKGTEHNFTDFVEIKLPKKDSSYFDVVVEVVELDTDIKDGHAVENEKDDIVVNNKHFRFNYNDASIYKSHTVFEKHPKACELELTWTISKVK